MSGGELRRAAAMRRMLESTLATLTGGLILWWITAPISPFARPAQPVPSSLAVESSQAVPASQAVSASQPASVSAERPDDTTALSIPATAAPSSPLPAQKTVLPYSIPVGTILLFENFSRYRDGEATAWGRSASVRMGVDRRHWLVPYVEGTHAVGCSIRLPSEFYFQCRYFAGVPEVTEGLLGWWKEPLSSTISFINERGAKYSIQWVIRYGNDPTQLNPLGSPSLFARKYYHTIRLPGGTATEAAVLQPTGVLRINWERGSIKVLLDNQVVATGAVGQIGQLVGFSIEAVKANKGTLCFTDFKIGR